MTEARIEALERRMASTEKRLHRYRVSLLAVVLVVTALGFMGATGDKDGYFDVVYANNVFVKNSEEKPAVALFSNDKGGFVSVSNKTGGEIVQLYADDYGNGVVGAYNRKGMGRTLKPGP